MADIEVRHRSHYVNRVLDRPQVSVPPAARRLAVTALPVLSFALYAFRLVPRLTDRQLWAEDGTIFLQNALDLGLLETLFLRYQGYWHFVPRLVAEASTLFELRRGPDVFAALNLAAIALLYLLIHRCVEDPLDRAVLFVVMPLSVGANEIYGNVTNFHWFAAAYSYQLMTRRFTALDGALLVPTILTGPFYFIALAARVTTVAIERHWRTLLLPTVAAAAMITVVLHGPVAAALRVILIAVASPLYQGEQTTAIFVGAGSVAAALATWGWMDDRERYGLVYLGLLFAAVGYKFGIREGIGQPLFGGGGSRYFYIPQFVVIGVACSMLRRHRGAPAAYALLGVVTIVYTLAFFTSERIVTFDENRWAAEMADLEQRGDRTIDIQPAGWSFVVPDDPG